MNKSIVLLSALALAANAYAADKLEAGTADAPNYYVIKAGRGTPYLAYSEDYISCGNGIETRIYRTPELSQANIWEVTPGEAEGTLHIAAYGSTRGLMNFIDKDGASCKVGAVATAVKAEGCDIYPKYQENGTVSLSINNFDGWEQVREGEESVFYYYTLDASNGSDFCGNWIPGDTGTNWTTYKLDMTNGVDAAIAKLNDDIIKEAAQKMINDYKGYLQTYIDNVPWVAEELQAGIEALNNLAPAAGYDEEIANIWNTACTNANAKLATVFDGKTLAVRNMAEMNGGFKSNTLAVDVANHKMIGLDGFSDPTAVFVFKAVEGGYTLYNEATQCYLSNFNDANVGCVPTTVADSAQVLTPALHSFGGFSGIALPISSEFDANTAGLNMQLRESTKVSYWTISGDCPIWSIVAADEEARVKSAIEAGLAAMKPYVDNVPAMVAEVLTPVISELESLDAKSTTAQAVEEKVAAALADANAVLATGMNGITLSLRNLRQSKFISVADGEWVYSLYNDVPETSFVFKAQADGGYILHNEAAGVYVGPAEDQEGETNVTLATNEADAQVVYPFLCKGGEYCGVAMALEAEPTSASLALNTNNNAHIFHTYYASDAGSIFALLAPNTVSSINEVGAPKIKIQGIYDLSGRKLAAPVKGINIINGRKVLVK